MKKRKGFTLVELLVVIAILAILATVSIVGYTSFIKKAEKSNDESLCAQLNTTLQGYEVLEGKAKSFAEVVFALQDNGFLLANLNPTAEGYVFVWEKDSDQFILVDVDTKSVSFYSRDLTNKTPGDTWYVITHEEEIADKFTNCHVTYLANDDNLVEGTNVATAIENAKDNDVIVLTGNVTFDNTTITKDLTFVSVDGTATIDQQSLYIAADANVIFQNVTFKDATDISQKKSSFYGTGAAGTIVLDGCTFKDPQWEGVQITPVDGAEITIKNCTFITTGSASHICKDGSKKVGYSHRMLHIQAKDKTGNCTAKITVINNTFIGVEKVDEAILDIDFINYNNLVAYGNVFKKSDGTVITKYDDDAMYVNSNYKIFVCKTYPDDVMSDADAYAKFTASK